MDKVDTEKAFNESMHGYPAEPEWLTAMICGIECGEEQDPSELKQMMVSYRLQAQILYEKAKCLTMKLQASEQRATQREKQVLVRDRNIGIMQDTVQDLERKVQLEKVRLDFFLKQAKQAAEKEKMELKKAIEKASIEYENEKEVLNKVLKKGQQEIASMKNRLRDSTRETAIATNNFRTFYNEYRNLEEKLRVVEKDLAPLNRFIYELAKVMNLKPVELLIKLEKLKVTLANAKSDSNVGELFFKTLFDAGKDELNHKDFQDARTSQDISSLTSLHHDETQPGSSSNIRHSDPSCPLSQKVLGEQIDEPSQQEVEKKHEEKKRKVLRLKFAGFKIPIWSTLKRYLSNYILSNVGSPNLNRLFDINFGSATKGHQANLNYKIGKRLLPEIIQKERKKEGRTLLTNLPPSHLKNNLRKAHLKEVLFINKRDGGGGGVGVELLAV
ncbi:myosin-6-like [Montipora capricornis]|uniref:myosin-6-like n=1 Tax=Montipora capricornis TaxID=246305 RepID=UPI0035F19B87